MTEETEKQRKARIKHEISALELEKANVIADFDAKIAAKKAEK